MQAIIQSLLDTDLYKFTMWQTMLHRHPQTQAEYSFVCRNPPGYPLADLRDAVDQQLDHLCSLRFQPDELAYLRGLRFIKSDFVDFLRIFRFQRAFIHAEADGDKLSIVARGPMVHVMAFEIFVLALVNELYFRRFDREPAKIVATQPARDAELDPDDRIEMVIDTFLDRRSAFYFQMSPAGSTATPRGYGASIAVEIVKSAAFTSRIAEFPESAM